MKKIFYSIIALLFSAIVFTTISCEKENFAGDSGTFTDSRDGQKYEWVKFGSQIWTTENMAYQSIVDTFFEYKTVMDQHHYGKLYIWESAKKEACPDGWHLPSFEEWEILIFDYLEDPEYMTKFNPVPGGYYDSRYGYCRMVNKDEVGCWWTSTEIPEAKRADIVRIDDGTNRIRINDYFVKIFGLSARCVKDE